MSEATLRIDSVELLHVRRRLAHPFRISVGAIDAREFLVMRAEGDVVAYSEANIDAAPFYTAETIQTVWHIARDVLLPRVLGRPFATIDEVRATWAGVRGHPFAKAAVEHLFWDLHGKQEGRSIQQLLGGGAPRVEIGTSHSICDGIDPLLDDIAQALAAGIQRIKIKIQPGWDIEPLRAVRRRFGDIPLMVDANAAYQLDDREHLRALREIGLLMIEQPLPDGDLLDHAELRRDLGVPICLDESAHDLRMIDAALRLSAADIINIKVGRVGGLTDARRVHDLCQRYGIPVWCGRRTGSGITVASELALASLAGFGFPTDHGVDFLQEVEDQFVDLAQIRREGPWVDVPMGPGIGVAVDETLLGRLTLHRERVCA